MRYLYYILAVVSMVSLCFAYRLFYAENRHEDIAISINTKRIAVDEFNKLYSFQAKGLSNKRDFINSLITKEVLIQEAEKEGINQEDSFRISIKNFYEQSLTKLLLDRKLTSIKSDVQDHEVDRYKDMLDKRMTLTAFRSDKAEELQQGSLGDGQQMILSFVNLSQEMRNRIFILNIGQVTEPISTDDGYWAYRVDNIEKDSGELSVEMPREDIRRILEESRREKELNDWVAGLVKAANVNVSPAIRE